METNSLGIELIKHYEGFRTKEYLDPVGIRTIYYGHVVLPGENFEHTPEEGELILKQDLKFAEIAVERLVKVPLTSNQFSALVSFTFNLGANRLKTSTLLALLNQGKYKDSADQLLRWVYAGGKVLQGLLHRRAAERELFLLEEG
jgi:lysozyme